MKPHNRPPKSQSGFDGLGLLFFILNYIRRKRRNGGVFFFQRKREEGVAVSLATGQIFCCLNLQPHNEVPQMFCLGG